MEGDRNSKGWGDRGEFLEMLGRLLEGLKEVRFIPFDVFSFCMLVENFHEDHVASCYELTIMLQRSHG